MPNTLIYGKINFCEKQNKRELQEIAYDMMAKAITHRFGLNLGSNVPLYRSIVCKKWICLTVWQGIA